MKIDLKIWHVIALAGLCALCYGNNLHGTFVFDDLVIVFQPDFLNIRSLAQVIAYIPGTRGLLFSTYALNYYWGGNDTFSYHVLNLILHVISTLLVYGIILLALRRHGSKSPSAGAFAGAAIFSVHTLFSSAVNYIAGRSSVLCAVFYFSAIFAFLKALETKRRPARVGYLILTGVAGLLAWQTKQEAITLPLFLASIVYLRSEKTDWRWVVPLAALPLAVAFLLRGELAALYANISANRELSSAGFGGVLPPPIYFRTYVTSIVGYYLPRFAFPGHLSADPDIAPVAQWYSPEFLFALFILAGLVWLALRLRKRQPLFGLGLAALLVSPLTAYAVIPLQDVVLEHRSYIPGLGIAILWVWLFEWLSAHTPRFRWVAAGTMVAALMLMTVNRNHVWASNVALWEDAAAKAPEKARTQFNLAQAYQDSGRWQEALPKYQRALELKPDIYAAYSNMAAMLADLGQTDKAQEALLKVTSLSPNFTEAFINLGVLYLRQRQTDKALQSLNRALELAPDNFGANFNKAEALAQKGESAAALESYKKAVQLRPDLPSFQMSLARAYWLAGDRETAEKEFLRLAGGPLEAEAYRNFGVLCSQAGQTDRAIEYLRRAVNTRNAFPDAHHDLGVAYLQRQMTDDAIEQFYITLAQQPDHGPAALNLAVAYQIKRDLSSARQTLETFILQFGNSPYIPQAKARLESLK